MYERFFNLRERPFALSPDPEYLYQSGVHREALDYLRYGIESQAGFIVITGEIGSGKTTLIQTVLQGLDSRTTVARLVNTTLGPKELLESILIDFGLNPVSNSKPLMVKQLGEFLVKQRMEGQRTMLVVDEAQNLGTLALEEIRLLSNQETEKSKLLQIVLVGQPNLRDKMATPKLEQLRQRVAVSYHLQPLVASETTAYINHRLNRAAIGEPPTFPAAAAALVHARSRGIPRTINIICDATLVFAYAAERHDIDRPLVQEVVEELESTGVLPASSAVEGPAPSAVEGQATVGTGSARSPELVPSAASVAVDPRIAAAAESLRAREAELAARESALARREREIAEQRRIMAEEYRLLRRPAGQPVSARPVPPVSGAASYATANTAATAPQPRATDSRANRAATANADRQFATDARTLPARQAGPSFWQRVFRFLAGEPASW
jgi:general secretion pathway protein A